MKRNNERAMSFMELMIAISIVGILSSAAVIPYLKTIEAGKRRASKNVLQAIIAGEKVFQTFNTAGGHAFCTTEAINPPIAPVGAPAASDCTWNEIFVDDPNIPQVVAGVNFSVQVNPPATTPALLVQASKSGGRCDGKLILMDETGAELPATDWPANGC